MKLVFERKAAVQIVEHLSCNVQINLNRLLLRFHIILHQFRVEFTEPLEEARFSFTSLVHMVKKKSPNTTELECSLLLNAKFLQRAPQFFNNRALIVFFFSKDGVPTSSSTETAYNLPWEKFKSKKYTI